MEKEIRFFEEKVRRLETVGVTVFGSSLIVAPHPDDETLGCGGTVALLKRAGISVHFLFVSDGTMSHPNSKKYPPEKLRALREAEALEAVKALGGIDDDITCLAFPDRSVPGKQSPFFEMAVRMTNRYIAGVRPETIFVPWRNDPHPDHRATWEIVSEAASRSNMKPRIVEYPIWLWEMGTVEDIDSVSKMKFVCVDISEVLDIKKLALSAHASQLTDLIDDDPNGFRLSQDVIAHFDHQREVFFESEINI